ncbi:MAG: hypothetical protein ACK4GT_13325 [Pararhodobacter sp.]
MSAWKSRYEGLPTLLVTDAEGRSVPLLPPAPRGGEVLEGYHLRRDRERLDHLAWAYLRDSTAFHRICDLNEAILPDALSEKTEIAIPKKGG